MNKIPYVFFGNAELALVVLHELDQLGYLPSLIITKANKPKGRGLEIVESEITIWARARGIPALAPEKLDTTFIEDLASYNFQFALLASYGKIIPQKLLDIFPKGILNIHPSLLPLYRGPSPIESALLDDTPKTGVSLMKLDSEMDHGDILAQESYTITEKDHQKKLYHKLGTIGVDLFIKYINSYLEGSLKLTPQNHAHATYCTKFEKSSAEITRDMTERQKFSIARTFMINPIAYTVLKNTNGSAFRLKITSAIWRDGKMLIERVIPEGKREMSYEEFLRGWKGDKF